MTNKLRIRSAGGWLAIGLVIAVSLMAGCSKASRQQKLLARANAHLQSGDYDQAEIEYLNALRLDRSNRVAVESLATIFQEQGRLFDAFGALDLAKQLSPTNVDTRLKLGMTLLAGGAAKEAREEAIFVLANAPTNDEAFLLLVDASATTNELADTRQWLEHLRPQAASRPGYHLAWGTIHLRQRNLTNAEAAFRHAVILDTNSAAAHLAMGNIHLVQGQLKEAETEFKTAADLSPWRSAPRLRYAEFKAISGDLAGARQVLEALVQKAPDYLPALMRLAELELSEKKYDAAEALRKRILARDSANLDALAFGPRLSLAKGEVSEALAGFEHLARLNPRNPRAHYQVALAALANNDPAGALASLTTATTLAPDYPEALILLAELELRRGNPAGAVASLQSLVTHDPGLVEARMLLAAAQRARGNLDDALAVYRSLARDYPTNPQPVLYAGLIQREQKQPDAARASFERALQIRPAFRAALAQLLELDLAEGKFDAALRRVQAEIQKDPKAPEPLMLLARLQLAQTNPPQAEATLLKVAELDPEYLPAQVELAKLYVATKREQQALKQLQAVVSKNPNDLLSWLRIAILHLEAAHYPAARDAYDQVLTLNPRYVPALNNLAWLYSEHLGDLTRALEFARKARDLQPNNPATGDTLGWVYFRRGEYGRALPLLEDSARNLPAEAEAQYHLGMTHYVLGESSPARVALQSAVQLKGDFPGADEAKRRLAVLALNPDTLGAAQMAGLEKHLDQSPNDSIVLDLLAGAYQRAGSADKAIEVCERSLKLDPASVSRLVRLSQLYAARPDKVAAALDLLRKAHDLAPADAAISHSLGSLAWREGNHKWALSLLEESARKLAADTQVLFDLGLARYSVGQVDSALAAMRSAQAGRPAPALARAIEDFIEMNRLLADPRQAEASLSRVQDVLKRQTNHVPALMVLAAIEARRGNATAAQRAYETALARYPSFTPARRELAILHFGPLNDHAQAYALASRVWETEKTDLVITRILGITSSERGEFDRAAELLTQYCRQRPEDADAKQVLNRVFTLQLNAALAAEVRSTLKESK